MAKKIRTWCGLKFTHHISSGISSPPESNSPHNYVKAPYIIPYQASYDAMSVGNKSVREIIFAVIKATNAEHNNTVNQRE